MSWNMLTSSNLRAYKYDKTTMNLDIQFKSGSIYRYLDVPMTVANRLGTEASAGTYFTNNIKSSYSFEKLD